MQESPTCSRCGRCCIEFQNQIHFDENEEFIVQGCITPGSPQHPTITIYQKTIEFWKKEIPTSKEKIEKKMPSNSFWYMIPSKKAIWTNFHSLAVQYLPESSQENTECLFLDWNTETHLPYCQIHGYHPKMCRDYPLSKGFVCKNHPERKYTPYFLDYQRQKIGFAIQTIKQIYASKIHFAFSFDLLTMLMDFGSFSLSKLKAFFLSTQSILESEWNKGIKDLLNLQLISVDQDHIEGISLKELEYLIDCIMQEKNW